ncbi:MAG: NUDIX hydrolase [Parafannyhessea sp.]|uniref:NUDIX hydrolase n=1 Tax=Parafannyhessea sp. TaxID=2847324 RepID=UPI003EFCA664
MDAEESRVREPDDRSRLARDVEAFVPGCEQEERDRRQILEWLGRSDCPDVSTRRNEVAHLTGSAWVVSPDRSMVLMAYHRIYDTWAWLGGHADGDFDLARVTLREVGEESGLTRARLVGRAPISLEVLCVNGHVKRGAYVSSHLHLNVTYLVEADPDEPVRPKPDENKAVRWFERDDVLDHVSEPWMVRWVYPKLLERM